jgi:hypothetical protein
LAKFLTTRNKRKEREERKGDGDIGRLYERERKKKED